MTVINCECFRFSTNPTLPIKSIFKNGNLFKSDPVFAFYTALFIVVLCRFWIVFAPLPKALISLGSI